MMWTDTQEGRQVIDEISKGIVIQVAPEEVDLFDDLVQEYYENPTSETSSEAGKDDALGFGAQEMVVALTPAVVGMVKVVLDHILSESLDTVKDEGASWAQARIKALFKSASTTSAKQENTDSAGDGTEQVEKQAAPPDQGINLSKESLVKIQQLAKKQARSYGIASKEAEQMANALIGQLVLSS